MKRPRGGGVALTKSAMFMLLNFIACESLTFSGSLAYVSLHPMPHKTVDNEFDTGVGAGV